MKISLAYNSCQGHQMCAIAAPEIFGSDDIGNAKILIEGDVPASLHAKARRAESNCPERAITITE
jgi:ferredoxin